MSLSVSFIDTLPDVVIEKCILFFLDSPVETLCVKQVSKRFQRLTKLLDNHFFNLFFDRAAASLFPSIPKELNSITDISQKAQDRREWMKQQGSVLQATKEIGLRELGLQVLPKEIALFTEIETLDISQNKLTSLPAQSLCQLKKLRNFYCRSNRLHSLPEELDNAFKNIQRLGLTKNPFKSRAEITNFASRIKFPHTIT